MSQNQNRGNIDFTIYDSMETQELEEILRLDAEMPEGEESDIDKILYIMEVLAERKRTNSHTGKTALEAYESFKQNYMPETDNNVIPIKAKHKHPRWLRSLTAAAAVLAILLTGAVTAKAFGLDVWKAVVQWSQETFRFSDGDDLDIDDSLPYTSLQDALQKGNVPTWLVPTYIPEEYVLIEVDVQKTPKKKIFTAKYKHDEEIIVIAVRNYLDGNPAYVEQSDGFAEEYEACGITFYLLSNEGQNRAVWLYESYECTISGDVTIEELKEMIESIQKG